MNMILTVILALSLALCPVEGVSIGYIGGVDGPTSVNVSSSGFLDGVKSGFEKSFGSVINAEKTESIESFSGAAAVCDVKFDAATVVISGFSSDASVLGAAYALCFHDDMTVDFTLAGVTVEGLDYSCNAEGTELKINYYGTDIEVVYTEGTYKMNFFDSMDIIFEAAQ